MTEQHEPHLSSSNIALNLIIVLNIFCLFFSETRKNTGNQRYLYRI